jgi:alpha-L-fucosidase
MRSVCLFMICCIPFGIIAQTIPAIKDIKTSDQVLNGFMDKRFGMFIHWGPVTLRGTEIGWSRNREVAQDEYDSLYREFNPVLFNAEAWVKAAKEAGIKYITLTSKHHDGFCLWPSAFTSYNIMNSPFRRDVVGELAKACSKHGIKFCLYYTVLDWYDRRYPVHNNGTKELAPDGDMKAFVLYMKNQLKELITRYHPYMIWFDGNWEAPWTLNMGVDIYRYLKTLDKDVIINNRLGKGTHKLMGSETVGDYATPEQEVGETNMLNPWESCITICQQWAWKPNDKMKTLQQCIQTLASTAGGNGNLLFNVGPMPDGRIEARQVARLKEMGRWLNKNGQAIYGTMGGPYRPDSIRAATRKGNKIYLHLFKRPGDQLLLPAMEGYQPVKVYFLNGSSIPFTQNSVIILQMPATLPDPVCSVIVMEMDGNIEGAPVVKN